MKKILIIIIMFTSVVLYADNTFNFTVFPGSSIYMGEEATNFATGLISSEVFAINGYQSGALYSYAKDSVYGVQFAGVLNMTYEINGLQAAGALNMTHEINGLQAAGALNIASDVDGAQFSGVVNLAHNVEGLQSSGLLNHANELNGVQAGIINIMSSGDGVQFGIVNIVTEDSSSVVPIGLINIYEDGVLEIMSWIDNNRMLYEGLESGSKKLYTYIYSGADLGDFYDLGTRNFGIGLGSRKNFKMFYLDLKAGVESVYNSSSFEETIPELSLSIAKQVKIFTVFAGINSDLYIGGYNDYLDGSSNSLKIEINNDADLYLSFFTGIKVHI